MVNKIAYVVDTNFIIENRNLKEVCQKLSNKKGVLYVTQVAVDERIAQECIEQKDRYDKLEKTKAEMLDIAEIRIYKKYEDVEKIYRNAMQQNYDKLLQGRIIPLNVNENTFRNVLNRAYMKVPPFIKAKTDKGFKDTLMWLSLVEYFKSNGEEQVVFISNDKGFLENKELLVEEFEKETGKKIEIKENKYYKDLFIEPEVQEKEKNIKELLNIGGYRDQIKTIIDDIRIEEIESYWGTEYVETFTASKQFDEAYVERFFSELNDKISSHIFDLSVSAKEVLDIDDRITDGSVSIRMSSLEKAYNLYLEIVKKYPDYLPQFYSTVAKILNLNYSDSNEFHDIADDDIPF